MKSGCKDKTQLNYKIITKFSKKIAKYKNPQNIIPQNIINSLKVVF